MGRPVRGRVRARMTGHADNIALLRRVAETYGVPGLETGAGVHAAAEPAR